MLQLALTARFAALTLSILLTVAFGLAVLVYGAHAGVVAGFLLAFALVALGYYDLTQEKHAILRNYPIAGHLRFLLEDIRPEMRQYFLESEKDGRPFSRDVRAIVYQRAKLALDKRPFGTQLDVYAPGFQWLRHSMAPAPVDKEPFRVMVGAATAKQPYSISVLNISAMSFGALSGAAIRALNRGAKRGGFAQDTGEGGFSPYHQEGGDIIWELGSGYFGCRTLAGAFDPEKFAAVAANPQIKMIEIKLSQGAKPGHGGVLPGVKISPEISAIRGVPMGVDCVSPARHPAFATPLEMMAFIRQLRDLSGGKPIGFKLCVGDPREFLGLCKAMLASDTFPDFIVVDGKEGGTGAAPFEFVDHIGMPMHEGLAFVRNALIGIAARDRIRLGCAGKIVTSFDMANAFALGADWCNAARPFMFALGCIQSLSCHTDRCPTGVATQNLSRARALVVTDKAERVYNFHRATLEALAEITAAAGLAHPNDFRPEHISRRIDRRSVATLDALYPSLETGELLSGARDPVWRQNWERAMAESF